MRTSSKCYTILELLFKYLIFLQVQQTLGASPEILYLSAVLNKMKNKPAEKILSTLYFLNYHFFQVY